MTNAKKLDNQDGPEIGPLVWPKGHARISLSALGLLCVASLSTLISPYTMLSVPLVWLWATKRAEWLWPRKVYSENANIYVETRITLFGRRRWLDLYHPSWEVLSFEFDDGLPTQGGVKFSSYPVVLSEKPLHPKLIARGDNFATFLFDSDAIRDAIHSYLEMKDSALVFRNGHLRCLARKWVLLGDQLTCALQLASLIPVGPKPAMLQRIAGHDPIAERREQALRYLVTRYAASPETRAACMYALNDPATSVRLYSAEHATQGAWPILQEIIADRASSAPYRLRAFVRATRLLPQDELQIIALELLTDPSKGVVDAACTWLHAHTTSPLEQILLRLLQERRILWTNALVTLLGEVGGHQALRWFGSRPPELAASATLDDAIAKLQSRLRDSHSGNFSIPNSHRGRLSFPPE